MRKPSLSAAQRRRVDEYETEGWTVTVVRSLPPRLVVLDLEHPEYGVEYSVMDEDGAEDRGRYV